LGALPKFDCTVIGQLLRLFPGGGLIAGKIDPTNNFPIRPKQKGLVLVHRRVPIAEAHCPSVKHIEAV